MHRYVVVGLSLAAASCAGMSKSSDSSGGSAAMASGGSLQTKLDPSNEVPQPTLGSSSPSGTATFTISGDSVSYKVTATGLTSPVTVAHIHNGPAGKAGPVVVPLNISPGSDPGTATGEGSFDASAIKATPDGTKMSMSDLLAAMRSGAAYVNVHTQNNKPGEVRGQISQ